MKRLTILLAIGFALIPFFSFHSGAAYAQCPGPACTEWTASNVQFSVQIKKVVTNTKNAQSFVVKKHPFTGTITLFTDNSTGDPTPGTVTPPVGLVTPPTTTSCFIGFVGTLEKNNPTPVYICISDLVNVSADKPKGAGENALIVGTGETVSSTDTGLIFLSASWQEKDTSGLPNSISLVSGKLNGGSQGPTGSTGSLFSVSFAATFSP